VGWLSGLAPPLVFRPINEFTKAMELFEDRVGGGSPDEGSFAGVVVSDILVDLVHQFAHALERTAPDGLLRDQCEPAFDLVEPACVGRGVVDVEAGMPRQPRP
jgi:hypothetical protein